MMIIGGGEDEAREYWGFKTKRRRVMSSRASARIQMGFSAWSSNGLQQELACTMASLRMDCVSARVVNEIENDNNGNEICEQILVQDENVVWNGTPILGRHIRLARTQENPQCRIFKEGIRKEILWSVANGYCLSTSPSNIATRPSDTDIQLLSSGLSQYSKCSIPSRNLLHFDTMPSQVAFVRYECNRPHT